MKNTKQEITWAVALLTLVCSCFSSAVAQRVKAQSQLTAPAAADEKTRAFLKAWSMRMNGVRTLRVRFVQTRHKVIDRDLTGRGLLERDLTSRTCFQVIGQASYFIIGQRAANQIAEFCRVGTDRSNSHRRG